jgi:hypothetical protein
MATGNEAWTTVPLQCNSVTLTQLDDMPHVKYVTPTKRMLVTFSNGDSQPPLLGFAGSLTSDLMLFATTLYWRDGKAIPLNGSGPLCSFFYAPPGARQDWENHVTSLNCVGGIKFADGHLISTEVKFDVAPPPLEAVPTDSDTPPTPAVGRKSWNFKGTCRIPSGINPQFVQPVICDSVTLNLTHDKGRTSLIIAFSNRDTEHPLLGWGAHPKGTFQMKDVGPMLVADTIYLADGKALPLNPGSNAPRCHFYFTDHGAFTQGWEKRLTTLECNMNVHFPDGTQVSKHVAFGVTQPTPVQRPSRDPASDTQ